MLFNSKYNITTRLRKINKSDNKYWQNVEKMKILIPTGWSVNLNTYLDEQFGSYLVKQKQVYPITE